MANEHRDENTTPDETTGRGQDNAAGALLTCQNEGCGCVLEIKTPCPHSSTYTCACGHYMTPAMP